MFGSYVVFTGICSFLHFKKVIKGLCLTSSIVSYIYNGSQIVDRDPLVGHNLILVGCKMVMERSDNIASRPEAVEKSDIVAVHYPVKSSALEFAR